MKIAYKALYNKVLEEKEALLHKVDKLVEENIKMRDKLEYIKGITLSSLVIISSFIALQIIMAFK